MRAFFGFFAVLLACRVDTGDTNDTDDTAPPDPCADRYVDLCDGDACELSVDVDTVPLSGTIAWNGTVLDDPSEWLGLRLVDVDNGDTVYAAPDTQDWTVSVWPGRYDVSLQPRGLRVPDGSYLTGSVRVAQGLDLTQPVTGLAIDPPIVSVGGDLSFNGLAASPGAYMSIYWYELDTGASYQTELVAGPQWQTTMYAGRYDAMLFFDEPDDGQGPVVTGWSAHDITLSGMSTDLDFATTADPLTVSASWDTSGAVPSWSPQLVLREPGSGLSFVIPANFRVHRGTYEVWADLGDGPPGDGRWNTGQTVDVQGPTTIDLSVPIHDTPVSFRFGEGIPSWLGATATISLYLSNPDTGSLLSYSLWQYGGLVESITPPEGTYEASVWITSTDGGATRWMILRLPEPVVVDGSTLDIAIDTALLSGSATLDGAARAEGDEWSLELRGEDEQVHFPLEGSGTTYEVEVPTGRWDVRLHDHSPAPPAGNGALIRRGIDLQADTPLDLTARSVVLDLSGVSVDGLQPAMSARLRLTDPFDGRELSGVSFGETRQVTMWAGTYDMALQSAGTPLGSTTLHQCARVDPGP